MTTETKIPTQRDNQRAAFEAYFSKLPFEWEFHRYGEHSAWPGHYRNYDIQCAWEGWQAAIEHDRKQDNTFVSVGKTGTLTSEVTVVVLDATEVPPGTELFMRKKP